MDGLKAAMSLFYVKGQIRNTMVFPYYVLFVESTSEWPFLYPVEAEGWIIEKIRPLTQYKNQSRMLKFFLILIHLQI